eukprot:scaffold27336_cov35-Cyclotella_meneghiniana.AAC.3
MPNAQPYSETCLDVDNVVWSGNLEEIDADFHSLSGAKNRLRTYYFAQGNELIHEGRRRGCKDRYETTQTL